MRLKLLFIAFGLFFVFSVAFPQTKMVSFDTSGKVLVIDADIESRYQLFSDYPDFYEARVFQLSKDKYRLEIIQSTKDGLIKIEKALTEKEYTKLQKSVDNKLATVSIATPKTNLVTPTSNIIEVDAKVPFLIESTLGGILQGMGIATIIDSRNFDFIIGSAFLGGAAGFFIPFISTYDQNVSSSACNMYGLGLVSGGGHGAFLSWMLFYYDNDPDYNNRIRKFFLFPTLLSLAESIGGYYLANELKMNDSEFLMLANGYILGGGSMTLLNLTFNLTRNFNNCYILPPMFILGSVGGAIGGYLLSKNGEYNSGDAMMLTHNMLFGVYAGLTVAQTINDISDFYTNYSAMSAVYGSMMLLGTGLGVLSSFLFDSELDYSSEESLYTILGTTGGGLVGAGLIFMFRPNDLSPYLIMSTLGGFVGSSILKILFYDSASARYQNRKNNKTAMKDDFDNRFFLSVNPENIALYLSSQQGAIKLEDVDLPFVRFSFSF